jgi:hypothetical protein
MAHDFDFVRMELLRLLGEDPCNRVAVSSTWEEFDGNPARALVSYTCNIAPSSDAAERLRGFVESGGRWLALHATNSLLEWVKPGYRACLPRVRSSKRSAVRSRPTHRSGLT